MLKFKLTMKAGTPEFNKKEFNEYMSKLEDGNYSLEVKKIKNPRSLAQNRYYWFICGLLAEKFKIENDKVHELLKYLFLRHEEWSDVAGVSIVSLKSTTDLNTKEFEEFLDRIRKWSLEEYNFVIPIPNETEYFY
jgi:hypothetical protein